MRVKQKICAGWDENSHSAFIWKRINGKSYCQRCASIIGTDKSNLKKEAKKQSTILRHQMFRDIWEKLIRKNCWSCGKYLGQEPLSIYFDHLLEKSKYPELDLRKDNIFICCEECHTLKTNGKPTEIHKKAIEEAKEKLC